MAVSGDTASVGGDPAYVYQRDQAGADQWGLVNNLFASDGETDDDFGYSVAIAGDTVVVGAIGEDAGGINAGAAYAFQRDHGGADIWAETNKLTAPDAQPFDEVG